MLGGGKGKCLITQDAQCALRLLRTVVGSSYAGNYDGDYDCEG